MSATVQELAAHPPPRDGPTRERLRLLFEALVVALQVAWSTLVGWAGATVALWPLVLHRGPVGRREGRGAARLVAVPAPPAGEAIGR